MIISLRGEILSWEHWNIFFPRKLESPYSSIAYNPMIIDWGTGGDRRIAKCPGQT